jgi:uncharacterized protein YkwD
MMDGPVRWYCCWLLAFSMLSVGTTWVRAQSEADGAWSVDEIRKADTARDCAFLDASQRNTILYINLARLYPKKFADVCVRPYQKLFHGLLIRHPGQVDILSQEGVAAVVECVKALHAVGPMEALVPSAGITRAALDHVADQSRTGQTGHEGDDGSTPFERMDRYGERTWSDGPVTVSGGGGECISYGYDDPREITIQLLVDDGVPSRGHRKLLLDRTFRLVGLGIGEHPQYRHICVVDFAVGFVEKPGGE